VVDEQVLLADDDHTELVDAELVGAEPVEAEPVEAEPVEIEELFDADVAGPPVDVDVDVVLPSDVEGGSAAIGLPTGVDLLDAPELPALLEPPRPASGSELIPYDPLQIYLNEIRQIAPLSREEEKDLAIRYREHGDRRAGYRLVLANLRLVVIIAREYQRNVQNILDLVQEGNIGLLEAVKQYDPFKGIRFSSYAVYWIRAYVLRYLINNLRLVKIGTTQAQRKLFFNLQKEKERLEAEGFSPEARLLAERLQVKESEVIEMEQRLALPDLSLDAPLGGSDDANDFHGVMPSDRQTTEQAVVSSQFNQALHQAIDEFKVGLDEKERAIIERRLFSEQEETLQEIADQFGLSRERIRQIEARLKGKLKSFLSERLDIQPGDEEMLG
jgi:RNA polymerase sigma-32 factor